MTTSINTKVLVKFETSEMRCVELRAEKLRNKHNIDVIKCSSSQVWNTIGQRRQSSKLRTTTTSINTKVLVKKVWDFRDEVYRLESRKAMQST